MALILPAIFVVGILAAIAIPAYSDYQKRAAAMESR
jgi:Tfp pilus assembly protein PilE